MFSLAFFLTVFVKSVIYFFTSEVFKSASKRNAVEFEEGPKISEGGTCVMGMVSHVA
jgi:hypothetical protein